MYALVMFASLLVVGLGRAGSWQSTLLGIEWSTIAGFEIGLLGIMVFGFAVAAALPLRSRSTGTMAIANTVSVTTTTFDIDKSDNSAKVTVH